MMFFPADERAIALWRDAAAWNAGDVQGQLASTDQPFTITLGPEWNLVGHPFTQIVHPLQSRRRLSGPQWSSISSSV